MKPISFNSKKYGQKKGNYKNSLEVAFREYNSENISLFDGEIYGIVYHFYNRDIGTDADNISKPIWDALIGFLYPDDKQIKIRIAGSYNLSSNEGLKFLNISEIPNNIKADLAESAEEEHIIYVECGILSKEMFKFRIEKNANQQ